MVVLFTDFALRQLQLYYDYLNEYAGTATADKQIDRILHTIQLLEDFPEIGKKESALAGLKKNHRYLVEGQIKIIYRVNRHAVIITDIFNCRQEPDKLLYHHTE